MAPRSIFVAVVMIIVLSWDLRARAKVFKRCELARELALKQVPEEQIGDWLCIAEHGSKFNSSAVNLRYKRFGGSAYYGIFQISDFDGCVESSSICGLTCADLKDNDVEDDIECMLRIFREFSREIGDGFAAWPTYEKHCRDLLVKTDSNECLNEDISRFEVKEIAISKRTDAEVMIPEGKVYDRCELAIELRDKQKLPEDQIATWVCIAYHESHYNTSAEGRLNADGSKNHGLFKISDKYWCSHSDKPGKACGVTCGEMRNSDISDDVRCIQMIHDEHHKISGNGFNAWSVYKPYCQGIEDRYIRNCFDDTVQTPTRPSKMSTKIYDRCELANDLLHKFGIPREQVATWVCIAHHESSFNTSAEGYLNSDGSVNHGLFQINEMYWCSPHGKGQACGVSCDELRDNDITDDVECIRTIFDEHQGISGDGFNAWAVYADYCKGKSEGFTRGCLGTNGDQRDTVTLPDPATTVPTIVPSQRTSDQRDTVTLPNPAITVTTVEPPQTTSVTEGKVYERCELVNKILIPNNPLNLPIKLFQFLINV